jgi:hypothetical protein
VNKTVIPRFTRTYRFCPLKNEVATRKKMEEGDRSQGLSLLKPLFIKLFDFLKWDPDVKAFGLVCYYFACIRREAYLCHRVKWDIKNPEGMEEIIQSPLLIRHLKVDIPMYGLLHSLMPTNKKNCIESIEIVQYRDDCMISSIPSGFFISHLTR